MDALKQLLVGLGIGTVFGITLDRSNVTEKSVIQDQMLFKDQRMLKVFLSAVGTSGAILSILQYTNSANFKPRLSETQIFSNSIGGAVLGIGMYFGGGCPGTLLSAFGAGKQTAGYGLLGGIFGAIFYSLLFDTVFSKMNKLMNFGKITVDGLLGFEFWKVGLPFVLAMFSIVFIVDFFGKKKNSKNSDKKNWNPIISGVILGMLQLPMLYFTGSMLGSSTQYVTIAGYLLSKVFPSLATNGYIAGTLLDRNALFGVIHHVGMVSGGFLGAYLSGSFGKNRAKKVTRKDKIHAFIGGFLLLTGARITGGCNSGHGLSGMASQSVSSYLATAAIFAGGIGFAVFDAFRAKRSKLE